jgi:hypothetical protein
LIPLTLDFAEGIRKGKFSSEDVARALTSLKTSSFGTQVGLVTLAQQMGVRTGFGGVSPLGVIGGMPRTSAVEDFKMQLQLTRNLGLQIARDARATSASEKIGAQLSAAQLTFPGVNRDLIYNLLTTTDKNTEAYKKQIKELEKATQDPLKAQLEKTGILVHETQTMGENIKQVVTLLSQTMGGGAAVNLLMRAIQTVGFLSVAFPGWGTAATVAKLSAGVLMGGATALGATPAMQEGGIVTRPTFARIGERGPEAIIPLSRGVGGTHISVGVNIGEIRGKIREEDLDPIYVAFKRRLTEELETEHILER